MQPAKKAKKEKEEPKKEEAQKEAKPSAKVWRPAETASVSRGGFEGDTAFGNFQF